MIIYLLTTFETDKTIQNNPPLSGMGITQAKAKRTEISEISFDACYTSPLIKDYGSAMLTVGTKLIITKDERLEEQENSSLEGKNIREFIDDLKEKKQHKKILIVAPTNILNQIKTIYKEKIIIL